MTQDQLHESYLEDTEQVLERFRHIVRDSSNQSIYDLGEAARQAKEQVSLLYEARDEVGYENLPGEAQELLDQYHETRKRVRQDPELPNTLENKDESLGVFVERKLGGENT